MDMGGHNLRRLRDFVMPIQHVPSQSGPEVDPLSTRIP
jgi:hypothetical protein